MIIVENFLRNSEKILEHCNKNQDKFKPRIGDMGHTGILPANSKFSTWKSDNMSSEFIDLILSDCDFDPDIRDFFWFIQIQKYEPGDFIVPHKDNYSVKTLHLVTLTSSDCDGLIINEGDMLYKIYDKAGQKIESDLNDYHWVDPVRDLRYSLVVGE